MKERMDDLRMMSGVISRTEQFESSEQINETLMVTITRPLMSGKALQAFNQELKRWKEVGLISKWQKNRLFSKVKIYITGIDEPYIMNITNIMGEDPDDKGKSKKEKLKGRLVGKVKSPYRWFSTFKQWGFYDIVEKMFDMIEEDVEKDKPRPANMDDAEWEVKEEAFYKMLATAKKKMQVFKKIDSGDFQLNVGVDGGKMDEDVLEEMAMADIDSIMDTISKKNVSPKKIADAYVSAYKTRSGKDLTRAGVTAFLKSWDKKTNDSELGKKVHEELGKMYPSTAKPKAEPKPRAAAKPKKPLPTVDSIKRDDKKDVPSGIAKLSMKESIVKNTGIIINE